MQLLQLMFSAKTPGNKCDSYHTGGTNNNTPLFSADDPAALLAALFPAGAGDHAGSQWLEETFVAPENTVFELPALLLGGPISEAGGTATRTVETPTAGIYFETGYTGGNRWIEETFFTANNTAFELPELIPDDLSRQTDGATTGYNTPRVVETSTSGNFFETGYTSDNRWIQALLELTVNYPAKQAGAQNAAGSLNISREQMLQIQQLLSHLNADNNTDYANQLRNLFQRLDLTGAQNETGENNGIVDTVKPAYNTPAITDEQAAMLRAAVKNPAEQIIVNNVHSQPVSIKNIIETATGSNGNTVRTAGENVGEAVLVKTTEVPNKSLEPAPALFTYTGRVEATGSGSGTNATAEAPTVTQRADAIQFALNNGLDSATTAAKSTGGEPVPAARGTDQPLFMQLAEAIRGQIVKDGLGSTRVRLQLHPENLGEVIIRLVYKDGNVSTHFHAATESAKQIIESSLVQLRETLAAQNLNLQQSTVTAGNDQGRWSQESNREHRFGGHFRQPGKTGSETAESIAETSADTPALYYHNRINHFV